MKYKTAFGKNVNLVANNVLVDSFEEQSANKVSQSVK
uniref:Uncharacterized protein n=1 Tax=Anguilla anguilla TaxID=7936 RepID=A0A0E9VE10_ANGAN